MAEKKRARRTKGQAAKEESGDLFFLTRRVLLAGIGAMALAHDEVHAFVDRLVERGELAQEQARDLLKEIAEKRESRLKGVRDRMKEHVSQTLQSLDVPTRGDMEALRQRLDGLSKQVEALLKQREE